MYFVFTKGKANVDLCEGSSTGVERVIYIYIFKQVEQGMGGEKEE